MHRRLFSALAATVLVLGNVAVAAAHTGSIDVTRSCEAGNVITAHLDGNVAASATWTVTVNGTTVASGTGPGPADLGPFDGGRAAGEARLTIVFRQETNVYKAKLKDVDPCPTPTPTPTATPTPTPTPSPTPSPTATPTATPTPSTSPTASPTPSATATPVDPTDPTETLPPTSTERTTDLGEPGWFAVLFIVLFVGILLIADSAKRMRR